MKGIFDVSKISINRKISDHDIIIGKSKGEFKLNERFTKIIINDKKIVEENDKALDMIKDGKINLINPKITIQKDNYHIEIRNLDRYEDFNKLREIYNIEYKEKYKRIEKIIRGGNISKEGWFKINKLFDGRKNKEIYNKDYMAKEIIE